ncbi:MAG: hypothetical protein FWG07_11155 [Treponema sp.]|nr:hypothetical protein [Treponema sp.]
MSRTRQVAELKSPNWADRGLRTSFADGTRTIHAGVAIGNPIHENTATDFLRR